MKRVLLPAAASLALALPWAGCAGARRLGRAPALLPEWIVARGDAKFQRRLGQAIEELGRTRAGGELLRRLRSEEATVVVRQRRLPTSMMSALPDEPVVWWNPDFGSPESPALTALHHELVHAYQWLQGKRLSEDSMELEAIGLDAPGVSYAENRLREELGLPLRSSHRDLPGFTEEKLDRLFHEAYVRYMGRKDARPVMNAQVGQIPRIEIQVPDWVEREGK